MWAARHQNYFNRSRLRLTQTRLYKELTQYGDKGRVGKVFQYTARLHRYAALVDYFFQHFRAYHTAVSPKGFAFFEKHERGDALDTECLRSLLVSVYVNCYDGDAITHLFFQLVEDGSLLLAGATPVSIEIYEGGRGGGDDLLEGAGHFFKVCS